MANSTERMREVTFVRPGGDMTIRMEHGDTASICRAARTLKARYFVTTDGFDVEKNCPIWGVFDMASAQENNPHPGAWSIDDPIRTFTGETASAAAVMWAMHRGARL